MKNLKFLLLLLLLVATLPSVAQYVPKDKRKKEAPAIDTTQKETSKPTASSSRTQKSNTFWDKIRPQFFVSPIIGNNVFGIDGLLNVGYQITDMFIAGVGGSYSYVRYNNVPTNIGNLNFNQNVYGGRVFAQHDIIRGIFVRAELELLQWKFANRDYPEFDRSESYTFPLVGGGINQSFGNRGGFVFMVLYNLNYDTEKDFQPYPSPWVIRTGVGF
jgi:hypothetical protein